jgi:hypothetical protein
MDLDSTIILDDKGPRQGYGWAFSVSTWVHIALLVVLVWLPVVRPHEEEKKEIVEFDVAKKETPKPRRNEPEPQALRRKAVPRPPPQAGEAVDRRESVSPPPQPAVPREAQARQAPSMPPIASVPALPGSSSEGPKGDRAAGPGRGVGEPAEGPGLGPGAPGRSDLSRALSDFRRSLNALQGTGGGGKGRGGEGGGGSGVGMGPPSASGFGFGNLLFEGNDFDFVKSGYASQAYYAILKAWYRRLYAMADQFEKWAFANGTWMLEHQNQIRFVIGRSGQIVRVDLINGSGCEPLDTSATDALKEVVLPPLPSDFSRGEEGVLVTFMATGDIHAMRSDPQLRYAYYGN